MEEYQQNQPAENLQTVPVEEPPPPVDAVVHVTIALNSLDAYINIDPPQNGGCPPTLEAIEAKLAAKKVVYGVNTALLKKVAEKPVYSRNIPVAKGVAAVNGTDGTYQIQFETNKELKPTERKDGTVDYYDLGLVENVKKGQILCVITLPTDGSEGMSVTGKKILPVKGKPVPNFLGKNTELDENGTAIRATINGQVEFVGGKMNVNETFIVQNDVDNSTGNIRVIGNVIVRGMVLPGFSVEAGGNIEISGTVEMAKIKAGGNVVLRSGITGSELTCGGDLASRFIENCTVFVKGSVKAEYIMDSTTKCGKSLQIVGSYARFLGGSCVVGENIYAQTIGSEVGIKTDVELGTDPLIIERQQELIKQIPVWEKQLLSLHPLISLLKQLDNANRLTLEKKETLEQAFLSFESAMNLLVDGKKELDEINKSIQTKGYGRVICTGSIYPGTRVSIGDAKYTVTEIMKNTALYNNGDGAISIAPAR